MILAYFPKVPGNLGQHFLDIPHANPPRSGVDLHHIHMERAPHRFFFSKKSRSRKIALIPHRNHFFPVRRGDAAQRRKFLAFWLAFALVLLKFSAVFSGGTAGSSCPQCTHTHTYTYTHTPRAALPSLPVPLLAPIPNGRRCESARKTSTVSSGER